ncbi:hypothetical protein HHE94_19945 [Pseudoalteromonas arctica]|uniref:Uncharacterized protein n=1 Tax=Pseudoalteromonas arctica TaxID=394751 RepID=A0AAP6Y799_9GAMM|nr:hypothetical protein [Pseudoalteromonas arctica]NMP04974.1 hypothetical protein [Pseudoalteromonas arctica]
MIEFNEEIVDLLNDYFSKNEEYVESVLLASYGFNIQFVNFNIQCEEKVFATISGKEYEWEDAPNSGPWGALGRQQALSAKLKSPTLLGIIFRSGDSLDIQTAVGQYESVIFSFPPKGKSIVMEIF